MTILTPAPSNSNRTHKFSATHRGNPCPVCGSTKPDCRTTDGDLVLCHTHRDFDPHHPIYHFVGANKGQNAPGNWGVFIPRKELKRNDEDWKAVQEERRKQRAAERRAWLDDLRRKSLPLDERAAQNRRLLLGLSLSDEDRADLVARGLTEKDIAQIGFRSASKNQELSHKVSPRLAGVTRDGRRIYVSGDGYLCPHTDYDGRILGFQVRLRGVEDAKYRWLKSGNSSHLPNGELPLSVARGENPQKIILVEGALKGVVAAKKWNALTVAAAGGNFSGCPEQLKDILDRAGADLGTTTVYIAPDAGGLSNRHVRSRDTATANLVASLGYKVRALYWGQGFDKTEPDADELWSSHPRPVNDLLWSEYLKLEKIEGKPQPKNIFEVDGHRNAVVVNPGDDILGIYAELAESRIILNRQGCGSGKTTAIARIDSAYLQRIGAKQAIYLSPQHRNPFVSGLRDWQDLNPRNNGFVVDEDKSSPDAPHYRWATAGEVPLNQGNCHRAHLFRALSEKNFPDIEGTGNPICQTCPLRDKCVRESGDGYGHRYQRRQALAGKLLRAHSDSLPQQDFDYSKTVLIWDEVDGNFEAVRSISFSRADLQEFMGWLSLRNPRIQEAITPAMRELWKLLSEKHGYYGLADKAIREALAGVLPENASDIAKELYGLASQQELPLEEEDQLDWDALSTAEKKQLGRFADTIRKGTQQNPEEARNAVESILHNWFVPFFEVLGGHNGAFTLKDGRMEVSYLDPTHRNIARQAKLNIFLDATKTPTDLALELGVPEADIAVIESPRPDLSNVRFTQVADLGSCSSRREGDTNYRIESIYRELSSRYPALAIADWKAQREIVPEEAIYLTNLGETRGSNRAQNADALVLTGVLAANIGQKAARYTTLTGETVELGTAQEEVARLTVGDCPDRYLTKTRTISPTKGFQDWIDRSVAAETEQAIFRVRPQLRPNQQIDVFLISNAVFPFPVEICEAETITPEAAPASKRKFNLIRRFTQELRSAGSKVTQDILAALSGIPQSTISRLIFQHTGIHWRDWKKISISLLETLNKPMDNLSDGYELDDAGVSGILDALLEDTPPEELAREVATYWRFAPEMFLNAIRKLSRESKLGLLEVVRSTLNGDFIPRTG